MVDLRHLVDLNPKAGDSWQGLTREQAKSVAMVFIVAGFLLADPPFSILPTDFLNLFVAGKIAETFHYPMVKALLFTYTFLAWGLIFFGIWVYPYNTQRMINGTFNKIMNAIKKALNNPIIVIASLIIFYFIYNWYSQTIGVI